MRIPSQSKKTGEFQPRTKFLPLLLLAILALIFMLSFSSAVTRITDARIDTIAFNATNSTFSTFSNATSLFGEASRIYNYSTFNSTIHNMSYNWTTATVNLHNASWSTTFNQSYANLNKTEAIQILLNATGIYSTFNSTYAAQSTFAYNTTDATVTLHNASWSTTFNASYSNFNKTEAIQILLNATGIYSKFNSSYDAGIPYFYNTTTATVTLHNASWSTTFNQSYANLNSSSLLAFMLNGTQFNSHWNSSAGYMFPFDLGKNISIGRTSTDYKFGIKTEDTNAADIFVLLADDDGLVASGHKDGSDNGEFYLWTGAQAANVAFKAAGDSYFAGGKLAVGASSGPHTLTVVGSFNATNATIQGNTTIIGLGATQWNGTSNIFTVWNGTCLLTRTTTVLQAQC